MIKVLIKLEGNSFSSLEIKGHAGSGPYGHDLVCSGVSALVTGCLNNINEPNNFKIVLKEGHVNVVKIGDISEHDEIVLETLITGLKTIEESYKQFIQIKNL
ncbi:MAG: ribosomal-processing cysteine protease Prp [Bacilli bacterium]|nr:ribosomal-processing cysteine protease Prp [Bacilli bacterium]